MKILDLGCNNCKWAESMGYTKYDYIGIDINEKTLKIAKSNGHNVMKYNLERETVPFKKGVFDMVIAKDVLEHIYSFVDITKEINRVLKRNGKLFVSVPAEFSFILWDDYTHKRAFSEKSITALLQDCGFHIDKIDKICGWALSLRLINLIYPRLATQSYSLWCHKIRNVKHDE